MNWSGARRMLFAGSCGNNGCNGMNSIRRFGGWTCGYGSRKPGAGTMCYQNACRRELQL